MTNHTDKLQHLLQSADKPLAIWFGLVLQNYQTLRSEKAGISGSSLGQYDPLGMYSSISEQIRLRSFQGQIIDYFLIDKF